jgi:Inovirus Coat protein B
MVRSRFALVPAAVMFFVASAHAELPTGVATSITAAGTDGATLVGLLAAAGAAVFIIHKILKKFGVSL